MEGGVGGGGWARCFRGDGGRYFRELLAVTIFWRYFREGVSLLSDVYGTRLPSFRGDERAESPLYVPVNSKTAHAPPPGKPPGIWLFWKILVKFPAMLPV